jgi:hypothetical protein
MGAAQLMTRGGVDVKRQLTHLSDGQKIAEYLLDLPDVIIGRGTAATIQLDGNRMVSRQHAVVRKDEALGEYVVEDIGGANGTFVNGFRVERHVLRPGDRIVLGKDTLRFDFANRLAISLKDPALAHFAAADQIPTRQHDAITDGDIDSIESGQVDVVGNLADVREIRLKNRPEPPQPGSGEVRFDETSVADEGAVKQLLEEMLLKAAPHLVVRIGDEESLVLLKDPPILIGYTDDCRIRLPGSRLFGKRVATLLEQTGGWFVLPESPFWSPVWFEDQKLKRIRQLESGDRVLVRGAELIYSKGEDR